jgi:hypothetical protein
MLAAQLRLVNEQNLENDRRIRASARATDVDEVDGHSRRRSVLTSAFVATVPDPRFPVRPQSRRVDRSCSAPELERGSGGKERLGGITKQGNRYLRQLLFVGAMAVIRYAQRHGIQGGLGRGDIWQIRRIDNVDDLTKSWTMPLNLGPDINTEYEETMPSGARLFFMSDRPGGLGGMDIYEAVRKTRK